MCVIALKKRKIKIDRETVELMFDQNPDGAGFALIEDKKITISKGYFTVEEFWKDIQHLQDKRLVLHFRIATSGGINVPMCHPFIVTSDFKECTSIYEETTKPVLFHNGMISHFGNTKMSDTCDFATNILANIPDIETQLKALKIANTKFIYIHEGQVYKIGQFYKYKGLSVSNDHFVPRSLPPKGTKFTNAAPNTMGFGNRHVSTNEDLQEVLRNMDGIDADDTYRHLEEVFALRGEDITMEEIYEDMRRIREEENGTYAADDYFEENGIVMKRPQPIFDSASGCYYEYDHDFDTMKKCK